MVGLVWIPRSLQVVRWLALPQQADWLVKTGITSPNPAVTGQQGAIIFTPVSCP